MKIQLLRDQLYQERQVAIESHLADILAHGWCSLGHSVHSRHSPYLYIFVGFCWFVCFMISEFPTLSHAISVHRHFLAGNSVGRVADMLWFFSWSWQIWDQAWCQKIHSNLGANNSQLAVEALQEELQMEKEKLRQEMGPDAVRSKAPLSVGHCEGWGSSFKSASCEVAKHT